MARQFDQYQQEAIGLRGGRHLVLAPPGCGKTDILTERVVQAHGDGVPYEEMLCLTFTNRAAKGMSMRIAERTNGPVPDGLYVGNIHRFCSQILFNNSVVRHNCAIIDDGDVASIIQEDLAPKLGIECHTHELMNLQHGLKQMTMGVKGDLILHNELYRAGTFAKLCDMMGCQLNEDNLARIYDDIEGICERHGGVAQLPAAKMARLAHRYQDYKDEYDLMDYDDLLVTAYDYLSRQREDGDPGMAHSYSWIEVDEVQDLNPLQFALIDLLAKDDATIVYLGDEQQAIFSFIGAKMETLEGLKRRCAGHIHHLHCNYRSPKYLLDMQEDYSRLVLHTRQDVTGGNTATNDVEHTPEDLCLLDTVDERLESYYTARFAQRYGQMDPNGRVAILVSTNREADEIGELMGGMGISHFKISGTDLFAQPEVRLLLAHVSVLAEESVFIAWARLLWGLKVTPTYTAARNLMREMRRSALLPTDILLYPGSSYLQEFVKAYDEEELIIFDTETTGLDPFTDDIIQIAAIRVRQGKQVGKPFNLLLETDKELPATVGGKPNPMREIYDKGPRHSREEGLRKFMDYCSGHILVGHNVNFDYQILKHNLRRSCPDIDLENSCPRHFDTLKYIRLVRPRLRNYKLGHLLDTLHLQGQNSHQADDDILATKELLDFCHKAATQMVTEQRFFMADNQKVAERLRARYADIYSHALSRMEATGNDSRPALVDELDYAYHHLMDEGLIGEVDKWRHLLRYVTLDMVKSDLFPTLQQQIARYITDLSTSKEADMCGGSLEEQYIISTVHKAKGLEFDTVIVYRAVDGNYPMQRSWTEKQIQEDARKLFVAISRSKKRLCITYDESYGRSLHQLSPFIQKISQHFTLYKRFPDGKVRKA